MDTKGSSSPKISLYNKELSSRPDSASSSHPSAIISTFFPSISSSKSAMELHNLLLE